MATKWAQKAAASIKKRGTQGSLTRAAKQRGYGSALSFAHHVESSPKGSDLRKRFGKKSNFAINVNS